MRNIILIRCFAVISGISHKIQPRNAQPFFIDCVIIERAVVLYVRHADDRIVPLRQDGSAQGEGVIPRRDDHALAVWEFIVQIAPEIEILGGIGCRCTHKLASQHHGLRKV